VAVQEIRISECDIESVDTPETVGWALSATVTNRKARRHGAKSSRLCQAAATMI
jgi:hypothetical protein